MLAAIGVPSLDVLIDQTIPPSIRSRAPLDLPRARREHAYLRRLRGIAAAQRLLGSYIGMGYYGCITPSVILRNVFENPGWYTPYTPYQAEIAQGRLESLLNFQTVVTRSDGDGHRDGVAARRGDGRRRSDDDVPPPASEKSRGRQESLFLVGEGCYPQTLDVLRGRAEPLDISVEIVDAATVSDDRCRPSACCCSTRTIVAESSILRPVIERAHAAGLLVAVATDLLALTLLTPPGEMGADAVVGNSQRFGVPLGYGGPHAAFLATREAYRPPGARAHHRPFDRRPWPSSVPDGAADARAAHPPREGDVEHLHGAGAPREHRRDVRGLSRSGRAAGDCGAHARRCRVPSRGR